MIIIEFYDKAALENIAGALLCNADKVILVGGDKTAMESKAAIYQSIVRKRGFNTEFICEEIDKNNLQNIVSVLEKVVSTDQECIFDLTGGDELYLVAMGVLMNKYPGKIQCHRFNFQDNMLYDCDADGQVCSTLPFVLTVEENINMYGGMIIKNPRNPLHTIEWDWNDEFINDVETMWAMCKENVGYWNVELSIIYGVCEAIKAKDEDLTISFTTRNVSRSIQNKVVYVNEFIDFLFRIERMGLIHSVNTTKDTISLTFKNIQIKRCLVLSGRILELIITARLKKMKDNDGTPLYNDIISGVSIDWGIDDPNNPYRTVNEIDVIAMKGMIPIFISCKNGSFDENELYKLTIVSERFGNKYAKKIIMATRLNRLGLKGEYLRTRMKDMDIRCIENIASMSDEEFNAILGSLCE